MIVLVTICILLSITGGDAATGVNCQTKKPTLTSGQTYTISQDCPKGGTYDTAASGSQGAQHCHCWSYCGYICEPKPSSVSSGTTKSPVATTAGGTNCNNKQPTLGSGSTWVANAGCTNGNTYNTATTHCHCWSHCGYICDPKAGSATTKGPAPTTGASTTCKQPTLQPGSTWVSNPGCTNGPTYNTAATHCHCWGHCGYICDPKSAPATTKGPAPTTGASTTCKQPTLQPGSTWVSNPGCSNGPTYNTATTHCHCWGHCGYICDPKASATSAAPTTGAAAKCPFGSPWVPPSDTSLRCICQSFDHQPYYKCTASGSSTTVPSTGSTSGGSVTTDTAATTVSGGTTDTAATTASGATAATTAATTGGTTAAGTTAAGTTAAGTTAAGTTAAGTTAAGTTAAGTTAAGTTAAGTTAAVTTVAVTTAAVTTPAVTTPVVGRRR